MFGVTCLATQASVAAPPDTTAPTGAAEGTAPTPTSGFTSDDPADAAAAGEGPARAVARIFELPPAKRDDAFGPRPADAPRISRAQILEYALRNPAIDAANARIAAMQAQLRMAKFAWVPTIKTTLGLSPGVSIVCDDFVVPVVGANGSVITNPDGSVPGVDYQYCRPRGNDDLDIQTVKGYFSQLSRAGIAVRFDAETTIPITTFGKIVEARKLAEVGVAVAELQRLQARQETALRVLEAHTALLLARESIAILREAWKVVQEERVKMEADLGVAFDADPSSINPDRDPDDLLQLELGEIELATRMQDARKIEATSLAALWALAGDAAPLGFDISERNLVPEEPNDGWRSLAEYRDIALAERPEAKLASAGVELRQRQEKLARLAFLPDIGLNVRARFGYASQAENGEALYYAGGRLNYSQVLLSLGMTWDLGFHMDAFRLQKARAERREADAQREVARKLLALDVERHFRDVEDARADRELMEIARDRSWALVLSLRTKSSVGDADFDKLRRALQSWAEYEFRSFEAVHGYNVALARLARAVGRPLTAPALPAPTAPDVNGDTASTPGTPQTPAPP